MTNTVLLEGLIAESGLKKSYIAKTLNLSISGFQKKVRNVNEFKAGEINKLCEILNVTSLKQKDEIFFASEVD